MGKARSDNILLEKLTKQPQPNEIPPWVEAAIAIRDIGMLDAHSHTLEQDKRHKPRKCWCGKKRRHGRCKKHAGFTCELCPEPRRSNKWQQRMYAKFNKYLRTSWIYRYTERCRSCNAKYSRYKTAKKAFKKIHEQTVHQPGLFTWFITLTRENITGIDVDSPSLLQADKELWIQDFHKFRRRKAWKETFTGGYWFYEITKNYQGDKVFSKSGEYIRTAEENELNGHLHILANAEGRIPMKDLHHSWGARTDFRKPKSEGDILRYLRGYLTKCSDSGVNMRPFGNIHNYTPPEAEASL